MKIPGRLRQSERGLSYVEVLISALLLAIGMMGVLNAWMFAYNVTSNTDDNAMAYSLGRFSLERVKMTGFTTAAEGSTNLYYNNLEVAVAQASATNRYTVTTSITSDSVQSGTIGVVGAVPAHTALRTVVITVKLSSTNAVLYQTTTYLSEAGI